MRTAGMIGRTVAAMAVNASGSVSVYVTVDESGQVVSAEPVSGHPLLKAAAVQALAIAIGGLADDPNAKLSGFANAVNLTDGLDGLAAGTSGIAMLAYTGMAFVAAQTVGSPIFGQRDLAIFCASLVGACLGFLWFNSFPAGVFMGDTGSYALGGAIASMAVMTKTEILLIAIGGIFVIEALSVIVQVIVFKKFRRRVFLMTPIHHHFEMAAWSETKIIVRFWLIAALLAATGFTLFFRDLQ